MQLSDSPITIVLVNYFNDKEVIHFINSEIKRQTLQPNVFVVNNGSKNAGELEAFCDSNGIHFLDPNENSGYLGGFVKVADLLSKEKKLPAWMILSNADIRFDDTTFFEQFAGKRYSEDTATVGPSIISGRSSRNQNPFLKERISIAKLSLLRTMFSNYISYFLYQSAGNLKSKLLGLKNQQPHNKPEEVYSIHGSFICMSSRFINEALQDLKKASFLFGEELYVAELALKYTMKTLFDSSLKIHHNEHQTTGLFISRKNLKALKNSIEKILSLRKQDKS